jgi:hypothetical protein
MHAVPERSAIRLIIRARRPPLDLDAEVFHYRVLADSTIVPIQKRRGARFCRESHHRRNEWNAVQSLDASAITDPRAVRVFPVLSECGDPRHLD